MKNFILVALFLSIAICQQYQDCDGKYNDLPQLNLEAKLISETAHGSKYLMQEGNNLVYIMNVTGTAYEMGYAQGKLMGAEINANIKGMHDYIEGGLRESLKEMAIPGLMIDILASSGMKLVDLLLELNYYVALSFIPERYIEEMQGISDASGISIEALRGMNMLPELIKAACTVAGTWSKATTDEKLLTLRALDWESRAPLSRYPSITVYHSTEQGSYPFANVGWAGMVGSITAVGSQGVSISEKVWLPRDTTGNPTTYYGKPWMFVMRDLAQFSTTLQDMADTIYNTHRTCRIHMGIASAESKGFEGVDYSWKVLDFFNDANYTDYAPWHPKLEGVMYFDKHVQPSQNYCVGAILQDTWGHITGDTLYRAVGGLSKTGDTQICMADVYENTMLLSYSSYPDAVPAYERAPMFIDLKPFYFGTN